MVLDERAKQLAGIITDYCLDMKNHSKLYIQGEDAFTEFLFEVGNCAKKTGAEVFYDFYNLKNKRDLIERADEKGHFISQSFHRKKTFTA